MVARTASTKDSNHTARRRGATTMGDSESSLFSFFFYVLFVYPATNWLLKPGRFSRTKGLTYAISLLVAIAAVKTGLELKEQGPNYYQLMKVGRSATALEIKRELQEDVPRAPPRQEPVGDGVGRLRDAQERLRRPDGHGTREVYDRFGPEKLKQKVAVIDEYKVLVEVAIFYAAWGIMTWMLTLGKHNSNARQWVFTAVPCGVRGGGRVDGVGGGGRRRAPGDRSWRHAGRSGAWANIDAKHAATRRRPEI